MVGICGLIGIWHLIIRPSCLLRFLLFPLDASFGGSDAVGGDSEVLIDLRLLRKIGAASAFIGPGFLLILSFLSAVLDASVDLNAASGLPRTQLIACEPG